MNICHSMTKHTYGALRAASGALLYCVIIDAMRSLFEQQEVRPHRLRGVR